MRQLFTLLAVLAMAASFGGTCALMAQDQDHGQDSDRPKEMTVAQKVQLDSHLRSMIEPLLPSGADPVEAAEGFPGLEQFVAAAHLSKNLEITFSKLKEQVLGPAEGRLTKALHTLKPDLSEDTVIDEVSKARRQTADVLEAASHESQMAKSQPQAEEEEEEEADDIPETGQP
jgi:hypothetical protein